MFVWYIYIYIYIYIATRSYFNSALVSVPMSTSADANIASINIRVFGTPLD